MCGCVVYVRIYILCAISMAMCHICQARAGAHTFMVAFYSSHAREGGMAGWLVRETEVRRYKLCHQKCPRKCVFARDVREVSLKCRVSLAIDWYMVLCTGRTRDRVREPGGS